MRHSGRARRGGVGLGVVLAGTLVLGLLPGTATAARNTESACPPGQVPEDGFTDVQSSFAESAIDCLVAYGITKGQTSTTYGTGTVTRGQMASFVMRTLDQVTSYERPADAPDAFPDDDASVHEPNIDDAAEEGIARGYGDGTFRPGNTVTRGEMASFVVRTLETGGASLPANAPDAFDDDEGNAHEANIDILADLEVVEGRADGTYGPTADVTREQMALFLTRALDVLVDQQLVVPPFGARPAPASSDAAAGRVATLDKAGNQLGLDLAATTVGDYAAGDADYVYTYDASDTFRIAGASATMQEFEDALSRGDVVDPGTYSPEADDTSVFDLSGNGPNAPTSVSAEKGVGGAGDDIAVTIDPSAPDTVALYSHFVIQRAPVSSGGDESSIGLVGDYAAVATVPVSADEDAVAATFTWTDRDVPAGTYRYRAAGLVDGDTGAFTADPNNESSEAQPRAGGPQSHNLVLLDSAGSTNGADTGDVWRFALDEPLAALQSGDSITLVETGGSEQATATHGDNATFALNVLAETINGVSYGAGQVLEVELDERLLVQSGSGDGFILYPLTVTGTSGLADAQNEAVDVTASFDRVVETDRTAPTSESLGADDNDGDGRVSAGDVITIDFDEPMDANPAAPVPDRVTITDARQDAVTLEHGVNATFAYDAAKDSLTITVNSGDTVVNYSSSTEQTTVTGARYLTDLAGNGWSRGATSGSDVVVDATPTPPVSINATQQDDAGTDETDDGVLDQGDVLAIVFDKAMSTATNGDRIDVTGGGNTASLTCGLNTTCTFESPTRLVVTVSGPILQTVTLPYVATASSGVQDEAGNEWDIDESRTRQDDGDPATAGDVTFD